MSKSRQKVDDRQLSIFSALQRQSKPTHLEGQFKVIDHLRAAIRAMIKDCPLSRHQIAGEMSHLLGETISKEMLDSWTRQSDEINGRSGRHVPAEYLPAFCKVTGDMDCLKVICQAAGGFLLEGPEALRSEIQKLDEEIKRVKTRKRKREMFLKEIER